MIFEETLLSDQNGMQQNGLGEVQSLQNNNIMTNENMMDGNELIR